MIRSLTISLFLVYSVELMALPGQISYPSIPTNEAELDQFIVNMNERTLPQIYNISDCTERLLYIASRYRDLKTMWLSNEFNSYPENLEENPVAPSSINLLMAFDSLENSSKLLEDEVTKFIRELSPNESDTKETIQKKFERIDQTNHRLINTLGDMAIKESKFLFLIDKARESLLQLLDIYRSEGSFIAKKECKELLALQADKIAKDLTQSINQVNKMGHFVKMQRQKREKLLEYTYLSIRENLKEAYLDAVKENLDGIKSELMATLELAKLQSDIIWWWRNATIKGLADGLYTKYLQYIEPMRIYHIKLQKVNKFESALSKINSPVEAKQVVERRLETIRKFIENEISELKDKGWQGVLERQKHIISRRLELGSSFSTECLQGLTKLSKQLDEVKTFEAFRERETIYKDVMVNSCNL